MKKITFVIAAMLAAANGFAAAPISADSSWEQIFASHDFIAVPPHANELGTQGVFGACATATEIKSISPQKVCAEMIQVPVSNSEGANFYDYKCARYETRVLSIPRKGVEEKCIEFGTEFVGDASYVVCKKTGMVPYEVALTQSVEVIYGSGENYPNVAFTKQYTIPVCAK